MEAGARERSHSTRRRRANEAIRPGEGARTKPSLPKWRSFPELAWEFSPNEAIFGSSERLAAGMALAPSGHGPRIARTKPILAVPGPRVVTLPN
jgi:hypothetical protein